MAYLKLLILSFICIFSVHSYSEIDLPYNEEANAKLELSNALHSAKVNNRYLLLEFGANYCPDCRKLAKHFKTEEINSWLDKHVTVLPIDVGMSHELNKDLAWQYGNPVKKGIPSLVLLNPLGEMLFSTSEGELARARNIDSDELLEWLEVNLGPLLK
tara:strand:- start:4074 stop:4547 length:474 start_codon:yes stop_codon:yes gene_type:complete